MSNQNNIDISTMSDEDKKIYLYDKLIAFDPDSLLLTLAENDYPYLQDKICDFIDFYQISDAPEPGVPEVPPVLKLMDFEPAPLVEVFDVDSMDEAMKKLVYNRIRRDRVLLSREASKLGRGCLDLMSELRHAVYQITGAKTLTFTEKLVKLGVPKFHIAIIAMVNEDQILDTGKLTVESIVDKVGVPYTELKAAIGKDAILALIARLHSMGYTADIIRGLTKCSAAIYHEALVEHSMK